MTQYVRAINIANNSIKSFVFDTNTANTLNSAVVAESVAISANVSAQAVNTFVTLQVQQVANIPPSINVISIANSSYTILDDTAANTGGAYLVITGTNFQSGAIVMVGSTNTAISTTFVDSSTLQAQIPAISSGTYPVYVVNTNGGTGIRINGLTTSPFPAWSTGATLSNQNANTSFSVNLSANSDSSITYANTTALPAGTTLAANGLFSGTVTIGAQTTYSFDVKATDVENQDASRTFSLTVTIGPAPGLYVWGYHSGNGEDGLNIGSSPAKSSPTQVGTNTNWNQISMARYAVLAIKTDGTLWSWGTNLDGQLGLNDSGIRRSSPVQVGTNTNWSLISIGNYFSAAIKTDGTLWLWGKNHYGQLGRNDRVYRSSPTQVGTATNWSKISVGRLSIVSATKTDGTLWLWGNNNYGQLGRNDRVSRSSPIQIGGDTNWSQAKHGDNYTIATKTNGTLWSWGFNDRGQLGRNDRVSRSSPTQVGTDTTWSLNNFVIGGNTNGPIQAATKTDGTLWTWGKNDYGQLGHNNQGVYRSSPTQVGTNTTWSLISGGAYNFTATKTDGTLWSWGNNNYGQLGVNNTVIRSSPTQVGTATNWTLVSMGPYAGFAKLS